MISPPKIVKLIIYFITFLILAFLGWSYLVEPKMLVTNSYDLTLKNWDPTLNGYKIVAISDIHAGSNNVSEAKLQDIVKKANEVNPDLIVILGDFVSNSIWDRQTLKMPVEVLAKNLTGFRARDGVFAVLGNQDDSYNADLVRSELKKAGIEVLVDDVIRIDRHGKKIDVVGIPDGLHIDLEKPKEYTDPARQCLNALGTEKSNVIVLTHNPDSIDYMYGDLAVSPNTSLLIAGHTHGGQIRFPFIGPPVVLASSFGQRFAAGHVYDEFYETDMFITTGIGTSVVPLRFGVPPEISVLKLYASSN